MNTCPLCGRAFESGGIYLNEAPHLLLCNECGTRFWTCATCDTSRRCLVQENPKHIQPVIFQTIQQGNMVIQQQVPNPELTKQYCEVECQCWHSDSKTCCRQQLSVCVNHKLAPEIESLRQ
jgi:hypothetical protein